LNDDQNYYRAADHLIDHGNSEALKVARELDIKVEALLAEAAE
jgi:hypothetical protein